MAEKGLRSETPPEVMAELCRVYLAWVDAPEAHVTMFIGGDACTESTYLSGLGPSAELVMGKRVKLVEVE